ncbi:hypothetical protein J2S03_002491 [Alicyclobacillus cycloheptanicus]|uniref:Uncharacterized protein n=1 Tax=Alicyclobacillus cycloheptanicus TaxID=1457 RepID=A0ABT9XKP7_9BACL|nr:hypothetical protein [Alicyclobacillus cycloheptanicus]
MAVYGRRPSETTLRIFKDLLAAMKTDPFNRKAAEGMQLPPKSESREKLFGRREAVRVSGSGCVKTVLK